MQYNTFETTSKIVVATTFHTLMTFGGQIYFDAAPGFIIHNVMEPVDQKMDCAIAVCKVCTASTKTHDDTLSWISWFSSANLKKIDIFGLGFYNVHNPVFCAF